MTPISPDTGSGGAKTHLAQVEMTAINAPAGNLTQFSFLNLARRIK